MEGINNFKNRVPEKGMRWTTAELKEIFKFPVVGYRKENGFLGIISKDRGKVHFFSKSTDEGPYVNWFIGVLCDNYNIHVPVDGQHMTYTCTYNLVQKAWEKLKSPIVVPDLGEAFMRKTQGLETLLKQTRQELIDKLNPLLEEGYSYVFECIDKDNDPHIIKYDTNKIFLLEVFKNQLEEEHVSYNELFNISCDLQVHLKKKELEFNNWEEFEEWKDKFRQGLSQWDCKHEGYVFEDQNGYRVKFKSSFYSWWKQLRSVLNLLQNGREIKKTYKSKEEIQVIQLMKSMSREELQKYNIIDIQDLFYSNYNG